MLWWLSHSLLSPFLYSGLIKGFSFDVFLALKVDWDWRLLYYPIAEPFDIINFFIIYIMHDSWKI